METYDALRTALPDLADDIIAAIATEVPDYSRAMEGRFARGVRFGVEVALSRFLDVLAGEKVEAGPRDTYMQLGAGEYRAGRSLDALLAAYRVGARFAWRRFVETGTAAGKRVQALGGAKNHAMVLPDADLDVAADAIVGAAYGAAGERCMALSVTVAVGDVADRLVDAISARLPKLVVGPGNESDTDMGPLITAAHRDKVAGYIDAGASAGAKVVVDGREAEVPECGFFLGTTLLDNVKPEMTVYTDEIFGPVLSVVRVGTYEEGLDLINSNQYANGTAIFTRDGGAARRFQYDVQVGMVGVNVPIPVPVAYYSFGGWKDSLFGDTHMYGPEGISFYTRGKVVTSRWPDPATSSVDLGFPRTR